MLARNKMVMQNSSKRGGFMNLKAYLATINITLKDFSESIEVSPVYLSQMVKGRIKPSKRILKRLNAATQGQVDLMPYQPRNQSPIKENEINCV